MSPRFAVSPRFAIAIGAAVALTAMWCPVGAFAQSLNDTIYATRSVRHADGHHGDSAYSGTTRSFATSTLHGTGYPSADYRSAGSGWNRSGWGGTQNPGWGYNFGPQLGGIGH